MMDETRADLLLVLAQAQEAYIEQPAVVDELEVVIERLNNTRVSVDATLEKYQASATLGPTISQLIVNGVLLGALLAINLGA